MKKLVIICICFLALSCDKSTEHPEEVKNLLSKISVLEQQNKILQDSLSRNEEEFLKSQILLGISDDAVLKVGKKNNIVMLLQTYGRKIPKYEIFRIENGKEIKIGENDGTRFNVEFIPKSLNDNRPDFFIKIPYYGEIIKIQSALFLEVEN